MRATVTFRYTDHDYTATVHNSASLASYIKNEKRDFIIISSNIKSECNHASANEAKRVREIIQAA
jgi:hypothetical protein